MIASVEDSSVNYFLDESIGCLVFMLNDTKTVKMFHSFFFLANGLLK